MGKPVLLNHVTNLTTAVTPVTTVARKVIQWDETLLTNVSFNDRNFQLNCGHTCMQRNIAGFCNSFWLGMRRTLSYGTQSHDEIPKMECAGRTPESFITIQII